VQQLDGITITVGDNSDVKLNTVCNNKMTASGWYLCEGLTALQGNYFGIFSDSDFTIKYVYAFTQEAIQINPMLEKPWGSPSIYFTRAYL
jgi:hypothetical protein